MELEKVRRFVRFLNRKYRTDAFMVYDVSAQADIYWVSCCGMPHYVLTNCCLRWVERTNLAEAIYRSHLQRASRLRKEAA